MYPFYEQPPSSKKDIYDYLTSWLQPVPGTIVSGGYLQTSGFRRAGVYHETLFHPERKVYVFMTVNDDGTEYPMSDECATYEEMILSAVDRYCQLWKISD
jgi:hypothetical protein